MGAIPDRHDPERRNVDFMDKEGKISTQHYAFLVSEAEFDQIFGRVQNQGLSYWADPARTKEGEINTNDGGRTWRLLQGPERPSAGGHHATLWQQRVESLSNRAMDQQAEEHERE